MLEKDQFTRNKFYENVAKMFLFPCTYEDCKETISWGNVEQHERDCSHRTLRCPYIQRWTNCQASYSSIEEFHGHIIAEHPYYVHYNSIFVLTYPFTASRVYYVSLDEEKFLIYFLTNPSSFFVSSLSSIKKCGKFHFKISVEDSKKNLTFKNMDIVQYEE
ncbi:hypothetical protein JTB14_011759 [Gonioctena quinquepunctata]|nr:hypothetical protein JTB14_011759 [Gonioctena quinquepunctata]